MIDDHKSEEDWNEEDWREENGRREELWSSMMCLSVVGSFMTTLTLTAVTSNSPSFVALFPKDNLPVLALRVLLFAIWMTSSLGLAISTVRQTVIVFGWKPVSAFAILVAVCAASLLIL